MDLLQAQGGQMGCDLFRCVPIQVIGQHIINADAVPSYANVVRGKKVDYMNDLYDVEKADIVPSGVAELAKLQAMGYTYIKP